MNCHDIRAALLAGESSEAISLHLDGCVECRRALTDIGSVRAGLSRESLWVEPPEGLEDSIVAAITRSVPSGQSTPPTPETEIATRRFSGRSVAAMFGSAAAALVLIVGGLTVVSRTPAPDWEAAMVGSDATPAATAVVAGWNIDTGTRVVLEAADLGPAPEGFVYQLWFSKDSMDVSAGTFSDPSYVELNVGVSREDYPNVWIALQPIGAGAGNAGPALLYTPGD